MRLLLNKTPRVFRVGHYDISDHGKIELAPGDLVGMVTASGRQCDFTAHEWGFYATPSTNSRLKDQGFKTAVIRNPQGRIFVNVVEQDKLDLYAQYLEEQAAQVLCWLDEDDSQPSMNGFSS